MPYLETVVGAGAAFCTTASYVPQLRKCLETGETGDLSLKMLLLLLCGLSLWIGYGAIRSDWVIITANAISLMAALQIREIFIDQHDHRIDLATAVGEDVPHLTQR
jgi:MtN3 and saliva related transmembrane protein